MLAAYLVETDVGGGEKKKEPHTFGKESSEWNNLVKFSKLWVLACAEQMARGIGLGQVLLRTDPQTAGKQ